MYSYSARRVKGDGGNANQRVKVDPKHRYICHLLSYHTTVVHSYWSTSPNLSYLYVEHCMRKPIFLFSSSLCRPLGFWLSRAQSLLYCSEHGAPGLFSEEVKSCICPAEHPTCQGVIPCSVGTLSTSCSACATDNATRCGACHHGNMLHLGSCRPSIAASLDHYLSFDLDMPDAEVFTHASVCESDTIQLQQKNSKNTINAKESIVCINVQFQKYR